MGVDGWDADRISDLLRDVGDHNLQYHGKCAGFFDGSRVGQFVPETYTAWHAGNYYVNQRSVGIEHVGVASDPNGYSDGLYKKSVELVKNIRTRWKVPLDRNHIYGHYQVPDGNKIAESAPRCSDTLDACETSPNYGRPLCAPRDRRNCQPFAHPGHHWQAPNGSGAR